MFGLSSKYAVSDAYLLHTHTKSNDGSGDYIQEIFPAGEQKSLLLSLAALSI